MSKGTVDYLKGVLATVAALFLSVWIPTIWTLAGDLSSEKATGITVIAWGILGRIASPWFWIIAILFSVFFYFSARFENKSPRLVFFWIPTITASVVGLCSWVLTIWIASRLSIH